MSKASQRNARMRHYLLLVITKHYQHICCLNKHLFLVGSFENTESHILTGSGERARAPLHLPYDLTATKSIKPVWDPGNHSHQSEALVSKQISLTLPYSNHNLFTSYEFSYTTQCHMSTSLRTSQT